MKISLRPEIRELDEAVHGTMEDAELTRLELDPLSVIDFSANVNPFGPSPNVRAALECVALNQYPDRESLLFRREIGKILEVPEDHVIAGNGSGELLSMIAQAFIRPNDDVLIVGPTYAEYARSATIMGAACRNWNLFSEDEFPASIRNLQKTLRELKPRIAYICNPNNPTGHFVPAHLIDDLSSQFEETLFVVDEAFIDFISEAPTLARWGRSNVVVLRSMTKAYGLAGLRLGYLVGSNAIVSSLCRVRVPWSVNAAAQAAGLVALRDTSHLEMSVRKLREYKQQLVSELLALGLKPHPSETPFFLLPVTESQRIRSKLLAEARILVRDCETFGLPDTIRIGTRCPTDNSKLVHALSVIIGRGP